MSAFASAIYTGIVGHRRLRPVEHALKYRAFWTLFDLDELPALSGSLRFFSHNAFNLFSFHDRDHGNGGDQPLRAQIETHLAEAGIAIESGPIRLLCMPRILGYVFNPISVYFCHAKDGVLAATLYEVNNTFGQRHSYLMAVEQPYGRTIRQTCPKRLYVSPFMGMKMSYNFRLQPPQETVGLAVDALDGEGVVIETSLSGRKRPLNDRILLSISIGYPLLTLKVIAGIHWEALQLWLKGMKITKRPARPDRPVTIGSGKEP
jgi:DUF1365 family protein